MVRRSRFLLVTLILATWSAAVSGQQPNRKVEPYVAPLLPAQSAWQLTLAVPPAAGGAMDDRRVYIPTQNLTMLVDGERVPVPDSSTITTLDRETGAVRWIRRSDTSVPPLVAGGLLLVAAGEEIHALNAASGDHKWRVAIGGRARAPMLLRGNLLVVLTEPDELLAVRIDTREVAWRRAVDHTGPALMNANDGTVYLSAGSRILAVRLLDGALAWERELRGTLSTPAVGRDRVLVGSDINWLWALNPVSGRDEWVWPGRIFGGDVLGAAVDADVAYVASLDNIIRALNRDNGNQRWKEDIGTRPIFPPRAFFGVVVVTGLSPTLTTFLGKTGARVSTWSAPAGAELQGPPLIDEHLKPFRVAAVVIMRDGRVSALRPSGMLFTEPTAAPLSTLPGRPLPRERLPGEPEPATPVGPAAPGRLTNP